MVHLGFHRLSPCHLDRGSTTTDKSYVSEERRVRFLLMRTAYAKDDSGSTRECGRACTCQPKDTCTPFCSIQ
eukprot:429551-Prorocentrum_lima.AAC.1